MFSKLDYRTARSLQICIVFVFALAIQRWLHFTHSGWIGFSVMMIYAGFDSGTSLQRTIHRFWGAMLGLLLSYVLWFFIRIDYGLILLVITIIVFMAFFSLGKDYASPTVFTVTLTALGTDYFTITRYSVEAFFFDYARSTIVALAICMFFEFFIFRKTNLTNKFYYDLQYKLVSELNELFAVVSKEPVRHSQYLKLCTKCNVNITALNNFISSAKHDYQTHHFHNINEFIETIDEVYRNIRQILVFDMDKHNSLELKTKTKVLLDKLFDFMIV